MKVVVNSDEVYKENQGSLASPCLPASWSLN